MYTHQQIVILNVNGQSGLSYIRYDEMFANHKRRPLWCCDRDSTHTAQHTHTHTHTHFADFYRIHWPLDRDGHAPAPLMWCRRVSHQQPSGPITGLSLPVVHDCCTHSGQPRERSMLSLPVVVVHCKMPPRWVGRTRERSNDMTDRGGNRNPLAMGSL